MFLLEVFAVENGAMSYSQQYAARKTQTYTQRCCHDKPYACPTNEYPGNRPTAANRVESTEGINVFAARKLKDDDKLRKLREDTQRRRRSHRTLTLRCDAVILEAFYVSLQATG